MEEAEGPDAEPARPAPGAVAVVFMTHLFNREVEERFLKLCGECAAEAGARGRYDVFILAEPGTAVPRRFEALTRRFDYPAARRRARAVIGEGLLPGNCHLRALDFFERNPGYGQYWFIEYDVVLTGHWGAFLDSFAEDRSDLLATWVRAADDDPGWPWLGTLRTGEEAVGRREWICAFFPVHRISAAALGAVDRAVGRGWIGHFEVLVPTAVARAGLAIADIGGGGRWTPAGRRHRHYLDCGVPGGRHVLGTVRFRPPVAARPVRNLLYHPCKTAGEPVAPLERGARLRAVLAQPRAAAAHGLRLAAAVAASWLGLRG